MDVLSVAGGPVPAPEEVGIDVLPSFRSLIEPPITGTAAILGESPAIRALRADLRAAARSQAATVLLRGETGVGKDLAARAIHEESGRSGHPFVAVNCSAVPDALLESEFFGHEAGAFTDARRRKEGLLEIADGGTVFLDEVADLGLGLQAKLLRFTEARAFRRVGGTREIQVDLRIVAATNADLAEAVRAKRFRQDLYYRLAVLSFVVPPLRERPEDVEVLAKHFLARYSARFGKAFEGFAPEARARLSVHAWPGNVRELRNAIERAVLLHEGPFVAGGMLVLEDEAGPKAPEVDAVGGEELNLMRRELAALVRALERSGGNQSEAARMLGVSRDTVRSLMRRHRVRTVTRVIVEKSP